MRAPGQQSGRSVISEMDVGRQRALVLLWRSAVKRGMRIRPAAYTRYLRDKRRALGVAHLPHYNDWYPSKISPDDVHDIIGYKRPEQARTVTTWLTRVAVTALPARLHVSAAGQRNPR